MAHKIASHDTTRASVRVGYGIRHIIDLRGPVALNIVGDAVLNEPARRLWVHVNVADVHAGSADYAQAVNGAVVAVYLRLRAFATGAQAIIMIRHLDQFAFNADERCSALGRYGFVDVAYRVYIAFKRAV